jgi:hypothetical protein
MGTMNGLLIFVSNIIHTSTLYSLDSTDLALAIDGITGQGLVCVPQGSSPSSKLGLDGVIFNLSRIQSYHIKSIRRNREACL